jgi:hypothetical protein
MPRLLVALCFVFAAASARAETAGQVLAAYGEAHALRAGRILHLSAGAPIESGDLLHTGVDSYLQIRFTDWSVISLRPRTDFVVDEYAYEASKGGRERAFFSLLSGGIRSLTGLIGHRDRANYRLRTTTSTIGIRGTHYSVLICKQDCKYADGSLGPDGLYGGVIDGRIAVSPYGGAALEREFGAGEYFRLDNANVVPVPLFVPPQFFWDKSSLQSRAGGRTFAGVPWAGKPLPSAQGPSDALGPAANADPTGIAGSLLRTDGSLALSPITAPVLSQVGELAGSTVGTVTAPVTSLVGSTVATLNPAIAPVGSLVGSVATPVIQPVAPVIAPVAPVIAPILTPIAAPVAPVTGPIALPVAPTLPPITGGLPSLLPRR